MKIEIKILNPVRLTKLFIAASRWLSKYADVLNDLNVLRRTTSITKRI